MGVVIQEVVQSEVSGVLFTHDPVSGNVNRMVLDASYGLGEVRFNPFKSNGISHNYELH